MLGVTALAPTLALAQVNGGGDRVVLTKTVEPSFKIEPVVQRFSARRGEVIPFRFAVGSLGRPIDLSVRPVNLRQEESGIILHDQASETADALELLSPESLRVGTGEEGVIEGELTVPIAKTNYLSYGILVRESGVDPNFSDGGEGATKAGIRFVTQYVLRIDVETGVTGVGALKDLELEEAQIVSKNGLPYVSAYLNNPTGYACECYVSANLLGSDSKPARATRLGMLSRASLDGLERYLVRLMPNSRLRLESPYDSYLAPGENTLRVELATDRRPIKSADFESTIVAEEFPALAVKRAVVADAVTAIPAQIEIGGARSRRTAAVEFANTADDPCEVMLEAVGLDGEPLSDLRLSPSRFDLKPGRTKKIRLMLRTSEAPIRCARLRAVTYRDGERRGEESLPISILHGPKTQPELDLSSVEWAGGADRKAFSLRVVNLSDRYAPIDASLSIGDDSGELLRLIDGYGKWLAPQEETRLHFEPSSPIPPGKYRLKLSVHSDGAGEPSTRELSIEVAGAENSART